MKIALVVVTRLCNKYLREYVKYYNEIGIDKIYVYDNNREGEEDVTDVLLDYMFEDIVEIIPFSMIEQDIKENAYQDFYEKHGQEYDWICMFDDDEYLKITNKISIKDFLSNQKFNLRFGVCVPTINFCDSNIIVNDKNTRIDSYKSVIDLKNIWKDSLYKTIIKGGLNVCYIKGAYNNNGTEITYNEQCRIPCVDGKVIYNMVDCDGNFLDINNKSTLTMFQVNNAFLKKIPTGCIDDFINITMKRICDNVECNDFYHEYFIKYNEDTPEKYNYYLEHTNK